MPLNPRLAAGSRGSRLTPAPMASHPWNLPADRERPTGCYGLSSGSGSPCRNPGGPGGTRGRTESTETLRLLYQRPTPTRVVAVASESVSRTRGSSFAVKPSLHSLARRSLPCISSMHWRTLRHAESAARWWSGAQARHRPRLRGVAQAAWGAAMPTTNTPAHAYLSHHRRTPPLSLLDTYRVVIACSEADRALGAYLDRCCPPYPVRSAPAKLPPVRRLKMGGFFLILGIGPALIPIEPRSLARRRHEDRREVKWMAREL